MGELEAIGELGPFTENPGDGPANSAEAKERNAKRFCLHLSIQQG